MKKVILSWYYKYIEPSTSAVRLCYKILNTSDKNRLIKQQRINKLYYKYKVSIGAKTKIDIGLSLPHPSNIVVGKGVSIGKNCTIYQNVTIGKRRGKLDLEWDYPNIGDDVTIFPGAIIIGDIKIGNNCVIGANSMVQSSVEANSVFYNVTKKNIKERGKI